MELVKMKNNDKKESSDSSSYGYVSAQANLKPKTEQQEFNSTSSNDEENGQRRNVTPHTNLQKPRPKKKVISAAEKRELRRKKLIERSKQKRLKVRFFKKSNFWILPPKIGQQILVNGMFQIMPNLRWWIFDNFKQAKIEFFAK